MKGRWLPFLATTAALALAVVAPAQDRGRGRSGGGGGSSERSSPQRGGGSSERAPSRSGGERREAPTRSSDQGRSRTERSSPTRGGSERTSPPREPSRTGGDPAGRERRPSSTPPTDTRDPGRRNDPSSGERRNPFERDGGRTRTDRTPSNTETRRGSGGFGNIDRNNPSLDRPMRSRSSRSGSVSYGTIHNGYGNSRPTRYSGAPGRGTLNQQIRRTRVGSGYNVSFGGVFGGLRVGYSAYNGYWRDDNFCYPFYVFNPWTPNTYCVASPWYRYSYLPAYVNTTRVVVVNNYIPTWGTDGWDSYDYDRRDRSNEALNDSLDDLRDAFERNSTRYADRLVPETGQVAIYNDGRYDYSIAAEDFQDMFLDGVEQSKTKRYEIIEVQTRRDEVHVRARHEYEDSWGQNQVVFHTLTLKRERGDQFVIREFGTE